MNERLVLSIGMPRAGSGWHFNLIHDLVVASGGQDSRTIRKRYMLKKILTEVNCNIGTLSAYRLLFTLVPTLFGNRYTLKTHSGPGQLSELFINLGWIKPIYIYRDPRDALLSAFEYGQRKKLSRRKGAFTDLNDLDEAITFIHRYVLISEDWLANPKVFHVKYEYLLKDYDSETDRLLGFLNIDSRHERIKNITKRFRPEQGSQSQPGTHYVKGKIGRYNTEFTDSQKDLCINLFGDYLSRQGYIL